MNETDYNGNKLSFWMFGKNGQLTLGKLKDYEDDALIYMESSNAHMRGNTFWSQKATDTYPVKDKNHPFTKALMIVGDIR